MEDVDAVDGELEEVVEEDTQRGLINHDVVDSGVGCVCATVELEHDRGDVRF